MARRAPTLLLLFALALPGAASALDPFTGADPWWILLHEPAVIAELGLGELQESKYRAALDECDLRFFPLRNKNRDEVLAGQKEILAAFGETLAALLEPAQTRRLAEIHHRRLGTAALLQAEPAKALDYRGTQRDAVAKIIDETTLAVAELEKRAAAGEPRAPLEKQFAQLRRAEQQQILELLRPPQQAAWKKLVGAPFDLDRLGRAAYKAPELIDTGKWIVPPATSLNERRGKVTLVHFYAMGCVNCVHNYPSYRRLQERYRGREVELIGIQTPETSAERDEAAVRRKAQEEKFTFPILFDEQSQNWNAWGNSLWPSVYLIDQRGYLRAFWPGELHWQGQDGEAFIGAKLDELLAEADR